MRDRFESQKFKSLNIFRRISNWPKIDEFRLIPSTMKNCYDDRCGTNTIHNNTPLILSFLDLLLKDSSFFLPFNTLHSQFNWIFFFEEEWKKQKSAIKLSSSWVKFSNSTRPEIIRAEIQLSVENFSIMFLWRHRCHSHLDSFLFLESKKNSFVAVINKRSQVVTVKREQIIEPIQLTQNTQWEQHKNEL